MTVSVNGFAYFSEMPNALPAILNISHVRKNFNAGITPWDATYICAGVVFTL